MAQFLNELDLMSLLANPPTGQAPAPTDVVCSPAHMTLAVARLQGRDDWNALEAQLQAGRSSFHQHISRAALMVIEVGQHMDRLFDDDLLYESHLLNHAKAGVGPEITTELVCQEAVSTMGW